ncbi:hypothetical protein J4Q44_G00363160 [Coregonus suidteri]|uniref:Titin-like n=1 Tax=Coregonus suidteri TaxID=861788 RepID=A0AAN8KPC0_9TELE
MSQILERSTRHSPASSLPAFWLRKYSTFLVHRERKKKLLLKNKTAKMPAPKRQESFQDPQAKRRKVDQNEVAMPSNKTTPASATSSNPHRAAPLQRRNKKKSPAKLKEGNKPAGSSRNSSKTKSTQKATTRTKSNPTVKNAKLLKATSASSKNPNSKGSLKRPAKIKTASTESDEELIRTRKPHCIRKYSNGDRGKRKGSQSNLNEEVLLSDPVQRDHNYGIPYVSRGSHSGSEENKRKGVREFTIGPETQRDVKMETQISLEPLPEQSGQMKQSSETHEVQDNSMTTPTDEVSESVETKPDTKTMSPLAFPEKASDPIHKQVNQNNSMTTPTDEVSESVETKPDTKTMSPPAFPEKASDPIHKQVNQNNSMTTPTDEVSESVETKPDTKTMSPLAFPEKASDPIHKQVNQNNSMTTPTDEVSESVETKPDTKTMSPPAFPEKASDPIHKQVNQNNSMTTPTDEVSESVETKPDPKTMSPPAFPEKASDPVHKQVNQSSETHEEQNDSVTIPTDQVSESVESKFDAYKKSADPVPELLKQSTETQDMQGNSMTTHTDKVNEHLETKVDVKILSPPAIGLVAYSSSSDSECESEENDRKGVTESIDVKMKTQASSEKASDPVPEQVKQSSETMQEDSMTTPTYEVTEDSMTTPTYEVTEDSMTTPTYKLTEDSMTTPTYEVTEDSMTTPTYEVTEDSMTTPSESVDTKLDANIKPPSIEVYSEEASDPVPEQVNPEQVNQIYIDIQKVQEDSLTTPTDEVSERLDGTLDAEIMSLPPLEASSEETHTVEVSESVETKCPELAPEQVMQSTLTQEMQGDSAPTPADQVSESVDTKLDIEVKSPPVELSSEETSDNVSVSEQVMQSSETKEVQEDSTTTPTDELRESVETKSVAKIKSPSLEVLFSALKDSSLCKHPLSHTMRSNVKEFLEVEDSLEIMKKDRDFGVTESIECTLDLETPIIVEDMEIGHCVVEVVGENGDEVDSDLEIIDNSEKTFQQTKGSEECSVDKSEDGTEKKCTSSSNQDSTNSGKKEAAKKTQDSLEKPKKQQMNPQARTKARLAALAEQKAAASKKESRQLNLLALCEEIADDIATDTMLIKTKEEEEEQVVTVEAEPSKEPECPPPVTQAETVPIPPAPAGPKEPSPPSAEEPAPAKPPAPEVPQRRFFISQVTIPLKIHEKKKLTRFQRLRQVELQREKNMSWTMVKKLKSDQKMIPETETKPSSPSLSTPEAAPVPVTTPPPPSASPAAPTVAALSSAPAPTSPAVTPKVEPLKVEPPKVTPSKGPTLRKRTLPAVPPPMPNGLKAQKAKPVVEYKPYKARPKYSFDDFELDDEPKPTVQKAVLPTAQRAAVRPTPTSIQRAAVRSTPTSTQRAAVTSTLTTIQRVAVTPTLTTIQRAAVRPTPAAENGKHEDSKPTVQKPGVPTGQKTKTVPTVLKAVETPTPMSKNGKHEDSKLTVQKADMPRPSVQKAAVVPTPCPKTEAPPTPKTGKDEDSIAPVSSPPSEEPPRDSVDKEQCEEKPAVTAIKPTSPEVRSEDNTTTEKASDSGVVQSAGNSSPLSDTRLQKEIKKLKEADQDGNQAIIDAGQKHFGAVTCSVCGMLYSAANPEDESQHLLFHNQFISAVRYVGWKKERILGEYPDGKIILVLPDDPKYALKKVEEIREMVDNDLGFQQVETKCPSQTKTFLFISNDKKVAGCLIAEHIQEGYRVIEEAVPEGSEGEKVMFERQRAWCCSTNPEPALCGISRIWVFSMTRRRGIASRMIECLRNNFIYGSYLSKEEIAFSDPTPDGKLFATHYCGTSQFLVYNFVSGTCSDQPSPNLV